MQPSMPPPGMPKKPTPPPMDATSDESGFACPSCGAKLRCEPAEESNMEHEQLGMDEPEA